MKLLLASQSPRRRELIALLGLPFTALAADADEESVTNPDPAVNVVETAVLKSAVIQTQLAAKQERTLIVTADTIVALAGHMLNKPEDVAEAKCMLINLRHRTHEVHTGYVLTDIQSGQVIRGVHTARVTMRNYSDEEIETYVASGDPLDKAGAYAIQHPTFRPVAQLDGCFLSVMGLPVCDLILALQPFGLAEMADVSAVVHAHQNTPCPILNRIMTAQS
ncbi:MAG: septum formation protein Maf [Chloroflexi bacterium]|nr:septum formation protein Maf [Chloroflexota bacterium]